MEYRKRIDNENPIRLVQPKHSNTSIPVSLSNLKSIRKHAPKQNQEATLVRARKKLNQFQIAKAASACTSAIQKIDITNHQFNCKYKHSKFHLKFVINRISQSSQIIFEIIRLGRSSFIFQKHLHFSNSEMDISKPPIQLQIQAFLIPS